MTVEQDRRSVEDAIGEVTFQHAGTFDDATESAKQETATIEGVFRRDERIAVLSQLAREMRESEGACELVYAWATTCTERADTLAKGVDP